ncbi:1-deoxy-D-xylulose-5-phosphate reductoisomerase [Arcanobacterium phocae]|uniref:1-deoxy-D-xylulose-5-phosphate reductoisomerase n=1 Tax=Arcanobacterium phocae TaxID=131112 RepID=UPI001C0EF91E|nr:1-deoxy-D-xylulose-5-phosphate reductoisomerase [Arcanobacterium phocae]
MRRVIVLGSTGSIGTQTLDVISRHRDKFHVQALGAGGSRIPLLAEQAATFNVPIVGVADESAVNDFHQQWNDRFAHLPEPQIIAGERAMTELAGSGSGVSIDSSDVVVNGITGSVGLLPTLAALHSGATLALANKESLVVGGSLVAEAMTWPGQIVPVDSEHSAIAQALRSGRHCKGLTSPIVDGTSEVSRIILTASGGPFRGKKRHELANVTPQQALNHPTWSMGPVVTINSSTLMNKGLELIEAAYLFDVAPENIVPVVHPQSMIHSMVEFQDGSTIAQASDPDMRLPIALGISWPDRLDRVVAPHSWDALSAWIFEPLDHEVFPAVKLAQQAISTSSLHPAVLNAANEECVGAFLAGKLPYLGIVDTVKQVLETLSVPAERTVESVLDTEKRARTLAHKIMAQHSR